MEKRSSARESVRGLLFLKTRMADCNVELQREVIKQQCDEIGIQQVHHYVDRGERKDVDRDEIENLLAFLRAGDIQVLVVRNVCELSNDMGDLEKIKNDIFGMDIAILELSTGLFRFNCYEEC